MEFWSFTKFSEKIFKPKNISKLNLETPKIGCYNMWTAPYIWVILEWSMRARPWYSEHWWRNWVWVGWSNVSGNCICIWSNTCICICTCECICACFLIDCEMLDEGIEPGWDGIISVVGMSGHNIGGDFQLRAGRAGVEN